MKGNLLTEKEVVFHDKVNGKLLWLDIGWHCLLKKSLKIFDFSAKSVTSLSLTNKGGMTEAFFPLAKVLIIDQ